MLLLDFFVCLLPLVLLHPNHHSDLTWLAGAFPGGARPVPGAAGGGRHTVQVRGCASLPAPSSSLSSTTKHQPRRAPMPSNRSAAQCKLCVVRACTLVAGAPAPVASAGPAPRRTLQRQLSGGRVVRNRVPGGRRRLRRGRHHRDQAGQPGASTAAASAPQPGCLASSFCVLSLELCDVLRGFASPVRCLAVAGPAFFVW